MKKKYLLLSMVLFIGVFILLLKPYFFPNKHVEIIAVGDTGTGNKWQYQIASVVKRVCGDHCEGVFLLGDAIYPNGVSSVSDSQFKSKFELPFSQINKYFYIILGNHDYKGCVNCMIDYTSRSDKWRLPSRYYLQSFAPLLDVFIIDVYNFSNEQQKWLSNGLRQSKSRWKIVAAHEPLYSFDVRHIIKYTPFEDALKNIICNRADLYLSGHDHFMADLGSECGVRLLISGGGSAPLGKMIDNKKVPFYLANYGILKIRTDNNNLTVSFIDTNGKVVYIWGKKSFLR